MPCAKNPTTWMTTIGMMTIGTKSTGTTNGTNRKRNEKWHLKFGLIGVVYRHENDEQPWLVQDNRKALKNEFPCCAKADVLDKIAEILDDMHYAPKQIGPGQ